MNQHYLDAELRRTILFAGFLTSLERPSASHRAVEAFAAPLIAEKAQRKRGARKEWTHRLYVAQQGLCAWCDKPMLWSDDTERQPCADTATFDHVVPRVEGGKDRFENGVACHRRCNTEKGSCPPLPSQLAKAEAIHAKIGARA